MKFKGTKDYRCCFCGGEIVNIRDEEIVGMECPLCAGAEFVKIPSPSTPRSKSGFYVTTRGMIYFPKKKEKKNER